MAEASARCLKSVARFVEESVGIKVPPSKHVMLLGRLQTRMRALGMTSLEDYRRHVFESSDSSTEQVHLIDAVTTNKTEFFREGRQFEYLKTKALGAVLDLPRPHHRLNVWCAGCSTGEEAYSLAMALSEYRRSVAAFDFAILATDVSTRVLEEARLGIYPATRTEGIPLALRRRYLLRSKDPRKALTRVKPDLRRLVSFHRLNFMCETYGLADVYDIVFFRNVAIYFDPPTQSAVVNRIAKNMTPGGYLFAGLSESFSQIEASLVAVAPSVYRRL